mmetsp:Transcript_101345/g.185270  ORF Transcript_101345/g.185270 Transcript_101345/m.185270 type:complete len:279 (-) Transcript_101345:3025-3861(-)
MQFRIVASHSLAGCDPTDDTAADTGEGVVPALKSAGEESGPPWPIAEELGDSCGEFACARVFGGLRGDVTTDLGVLCLLPTEGFGSVLLEASAFDSPASGSPASSIALTTERNLLKSTARASVPLGFSFSGAGAVFASTHVSLLDAAVLTSWRASLTMWSVAASFGQTAPSWSCRPFGSTQLSLFLTASLASDCSPSDFKLLSTVQAFSSATWLSLPWTAALASGGADFDAAVLLLLPWSLQRSSATGCALSAILWVVALASASVGATELPLSFIAAS